MPKILFLALGIWAACAALTFKVAEEKRLRALWWTITGILFGPIALLMAIGAPEENSLQDFQGFNRYRTSKSQASTEHLHKKSSTSEAASNRESWVKTTLDRIFGPIRFF